jgi:hypothetical protein
LHRVRLLARGVTRNVSQKKKKWPEIHPTMGHLGKNTIILLKNIEDFIEKSIKAFFVLF